MRVGGTFEGVGCLGHRRHMVREGVPRIWIVAPDQDPLGAPGLDPLARHLAAHLGDEGAEVRLLAAPPFGHADARGARGWISALAARPPHAVLALDPARTWPLLALARARALRTRVFAAVRGHELPRLARAPWAVRHALARLSIACATAPATRPLLARVLGLAESSVRLLPLGEPSTPGLAPAPELREHHEHAADQVVVGCLAEHLDARALDTVLAAVAPLARERPPHRLCLEVALSGAKARALTRRARAVGLDVYLGTPPPPGPNHLARFLQGLHVLLVPEASPLQAESPALRAALACGVPVVAASTPASRAAIRHGFNGLRVADLDPRTWRRALADLVSAPPSARVWMARQAARSAGSGPRTPRAPPALLPTLCAPAHAA